MAPILTDNGINRILEGEEWESGAILQILECKEMDKGDKEYVIMVLSDGATAFPYVMLEPHLNGLYVNGHLQKHTVIRLNKWILNVTYPNSAIIVLLNISVLTPGSEVKKVIGDPFLPLSKNTEHSCLCCDGGLNFFGESTDCIIPRMNMFDDVVIPPLTAGAINRMLNGENVSEAVLQILDCKKIPGPGEHCYRLLLSDGETEYPHAMLGIELSVLAFIKQVKKYSIVCVDEYVCNQVHPGSKVIILLSLSGFIPGSEVNEKIVNCSNKLKTSIVK